MRPTEALLHYQRLGDRLRSLHDELDHLRSRLASNAEVDAATAAEADARRRREDAARRVRELDDEAEDLEGQIASAWAQVPPALQTQYRKLSRLANPVVPVVDGQCMGCHVQLTANELQQLKRGERSTCQNCNRILVLE